MTLAELEQANNGFYVPAFSVKIGTEDVLRDFFLAITSVSVDLKEKTAGRFSFTVASSFDWNKGEFLATQRADRMDLLDLFAFGSSVTIGLGYGDATGVKPILKGIITEVTTSFSAGSTPELTISGADGLYPLTVGKNTRHWPKHPATVARDSEAVTEVASQARLGTDVLTTSPTFDKIDQNNESDLVFLDRLAKRNKATFYERGGKLRFGPRRSKTAAVAELTWGKGLLSFSPEANIARQVAEVRVHATSLATGKPIVGIAKHGEESGREQREESGGDMAFKALSKRPVLNVRAAVDTQEQADARALAILEERAQQFLTGTGECVGLPAILPDTNLLINGLGRAFSKPYYVTETTHKIDGSGYRTTFAVEETSI
ncbi:phage late control D family protein [Arthrobacter sp. Z4-13]